MTTRVYALFASVNGEDPSPWMIACEDEYSWEGDPDRCEKVFQKARDLADENGWDYREAVLLVNYHRVRDCFVPNEIVAGVAPPEGGAS